MNIIRIEGGINPGSGEYILNAIESSEKEGAEALIIVMDTPGGLVNSTREIVKGIMNADVPIVVYVAPAGARAGSAGVFITISSHIALMAPGTNIGAAHPVTLGGGWWTDKKKEEKGDEKGKDTTAIMAEKIENDLLAFMETIADQRGRNVEWAKDSVRKSLSVTEKKALELNVIDGVCKDIDEVLKFIDGKKVKLRHEDHLINTKNALVREIKMNFKQKFIDILSNPDIVLLLFGLGIIGLYIEFTHPGLIFPGVAGGISLILAFVSLQILPFNIGGLALILLALLLFILEFYTPTYGLLTLGGITSLILGSILLFETPEFDLRINMNNVFIVAIFIGVIVFIVSLLVAKAHLKRPSTGLEGMIGKKGRAITDIHRTGRAQIMGEIWNASSSKPVLAGSEIVVEKMEGLKVIVKEQAKEEG